MPGECCLQPQLAHVTSVDSGVSGCPVALAEGGVSASTPVRSLAWPPDTVGSRTLESESALRTPPAAERGSRGSGSDPDPRFFYFKHISPLTFHLWRGVDSLPVVWVSQPGAEMQPVPPSL